MIRRSHLACEMVALALLASCTEPPASNPPPQETQQDGGKPDAGPFRPPEPVAPLCTLPEPTKAAPGRRTYFVSPKGIDANAGGTQAAPLRSIAFALKMAGAGDVIHLEAGATFNEAVAFKTANSGKAGSPIVLSSDPQNRARLVVPAGQIAIGIDNADYVTIENLVLVGPGMNTTKTLGVRALAQNGRYAGLTFRNLDVSGFYEGLGILSYAQPGDGYTGIVIEHVDLHHNLQGGGSTYAPEVGAMRDVVVRCSRFHHNPGDPNTKTPSGNGFVLGGVDNGLIEACVAHDNGGKGTATAGPVGLWAYTSNRITIQFSESYRNLALKQDGDGFDLDIGVTNSVIQYCYSHDNFGAGYLLSQAGPDEWRNNVIRYNISENDAVGKRMGAITHYSAPGALGLKDSYVYGNTVYTSVGPALNTTAERNASGNRVFNNLFVTAKDQPLVYSPDGPSSTTMQIEGNLYWATLGKVDFAGRSSLDAWRSATGHERHNRTPVGLFVDPLLTMPGGGGTLGDPAKLPTLSAYRLQPTSPARGGGLDPSLFGVDPGQRDYYGTRLPSGVGYDIGAEQSPR